MINSKGINIVVAAAMIFALLIVSGLFFLGNTAKTDGASGRTGLRPAGFGAEIITVDILVSGEDWQEMLNNALSEQFIMADVVVNGTKFQNVGIRPNGQLQPDPWRSQTATGTASVCNSIEYISGQTCFGLQSFVLNNMLGDYSYMKEYVSYDLMREIGVDAVFRLCGYPGERRIRGLYLAVEMYNDSYEQRIFGNTSGMLYNVKSMDIGGNAGNGGAAGSEDGLWALRRRRLWAKTAVRSERPAGWDGRGRDPGRRRGCPARRRKLWTETAAGPE